MTDAENKSATRAETHKETSARHEDEFMTLLAAHRVNVDEAHRQHPTPPGVKFHDMTEADQRRYNAKRAVIDSANRAYNRAVKRACERHREEARKPLPVPSDARSSEGMPR